MAFQNCKLEKDANELSDSFFKYRVFKSPVAQKDLIHIYNLWDSLSCHAISYQS